MEVVSPGANGHIPSSISSLMIDPNVLIQHLVDVLEITLGASKADLESAGSLLSESKRQDTLQRCNRFTLEAQDALYVLKNVDLTDQSNEADNGSSKKAL